MRIKMTNNSNVIYGIITKMGTYGGDSAGYTYITFLHEIDPSDNLALHLMANSAITLNYYSTQKAPQGFPLSPNKWRIIITDTQQRFINNPTPNAWTNISPLNIVFPIGVWNLSQHFVLYGDITSGTAVSCQCTLSTANNSESNKSYSIMVVADGATGRVAIENSVANYNSNVSVATKTQMYTNIRTTNTGLLAIGVLGESITSRIELICAYL